MPKLIVRPRPKDFHLHVRKKNAELRRMYKTSDATLERWRGELELQKVGFEKVSEDGRK